MIETKGRELLQQSRPSENKTVLTDSVFMSSLRVYNARRGMSRVSGRNWGRAI